MMEQIENRIESLDRPAYSGSPIVQATIHTSVSGRAPAVVFHRSVVVNKLLNDLEAYFAVIRVCRRSGHDFVVRTKSRTGKYQLMRLDLNKRSKSALYRGDVVTFENREDWEKASKRKVWAICRPTTYGPDGRVITVVRTMRKLPNHFIEELGE